MIYNKMSIAVILEGMSIFLFCGFLSLFVFPRMLIRLVYFFPQTVYFACKKKIFWKAVKPLFSDVLFWGGIIFALYAIGFAVNPDIFYMLLFSPVSVACWILFFIIYLLKIIFQFSIYQDEYFTTIYLPFIRPEAKKQYESFLSNLHSLQGEVYFAISKRRNLNYLEEKALETYIRNKNQK